MKNVDIVLKNYRYIKNLYVDGENVKLKRNKNEKAYVYSFETEKNSILVEIKYYNRLYNVNWLFMELLFFVISILGLFDIKEKNTKYYCYKSVFSLDNQTNKILLDYPKREKADKLVTTSTNLVYNEEENIIKTDDELVYRSKLLKRIKLITILSLIVTGLVAVAIIVVTNINSL